MILTDDQFQIEIEIYFKKKFSQLIVSKSRFNIYRVDISLNSVWKYNCLIVKKIFSFPEKFLSLAENSLNKIMNLFSNSKKKINGFFVFYKMNLIGPFGLEYTSITKLGSNSIGELVCIQGTIIFCGKVKVKKKYSVFFCTKNSKLYLKNEDYGDIGENYDLLTDFQISGMKIEHGLSRYFEQQKIILSEIFSHEKKGWNKNINVFIYKDLVNNYLIGEVVEVCGIFKPSKIGKISVNFGLFDVYLSAISIKKRVIKENKITNKLDFLLINYFSMFSDCFERLSSLIVPQIQGINLIKKSLLLSLMNLNPRKKGFSFFRNSINLLLIGDYNLIKDEIFSSISKIFSIFWVDKYENFLFEAENLGKINPKNLDSEKFFSKMLFFLKSEFAYFDNLEHLSFRDKNILGELIEKGIETKIVNKENSFNNLLPSVIGWVKIKNKKYDLNDSIQKNIDFPNILFNQFDLALFLPDKISPSRENDDAKLILHNHCFSKKKYLFSDTSEDYFQEYDRKKNHKNTIKKDKPFRDLFFMNYPLISQNFLKNYIFYARSEVDCFLSKDVVDFLMDKYGSLKLKFESSEPNDIRVFETIVKFCFAFTRCHLRDVVSVHDIEYILNSFSLLNNIKSQIILNVNKNIKKKFCVGKEKSELNIVIKKDGEGKILNSNFKLNKIKPKKINKKNWKSLSSNLSSFFIKNNIEKFTFNSLKERAISIWNYKEVCICIGNNLVKV
jgi:DNA replicative helicase MCM subunit Mcm2 (Cdc46/Mcm family)